MRTFCNSCSMYLNNCNQPPWVPNVWNLRQRAYAFMLLVPSILFLLRVIAQLVQLIWSIPWLPDFSVWHSGALPYELLLTAQIAILFAMAIFLTRLFLGKVRYNPQLGHLIKRVAMIYFSLMLFRLIAGLTFLAHLHWFSSHLPAFFHLVLASFLFLVGQLHLSKKGGNL